MCKERQTMCGGDNQDLSGQIQSTKRLPDRNREGWEGKGDESVCGPCASPTSQRSSFNAGLTFRQKMQEVGVGRKNWLGWTRGGREEKGVAENAVTHGPFRRSRLF